MWGQAMAEPADQQHPRLDDTAVQERLTRLDELLGQVEQIPGPAGELALEAVSALAEVYGEALARATAYVSRAPTLVEAITGDELLGHLLVLHGIHPDPVERRVAQALDALRPALAQRGGDVELVGIDQGVARVRLSGRRVRLVIGRRRGRGPGGRAGRRAGTVRCRAGGTHRADEERHRGDRHGRQKRAGKQVAEDGELRGRGKDPQRALDPADVPVPLRRLGDRSRIEGAPHPHRVDLRQPTEGEDHGGEGEQQPE
ncbi:MAG: NifU family protein [Pseudonocardiaceae bacterium]